MQENKRDNNSKSGTGIDKIVDRLMKAYGMEDRMKVFDVINAWEELMGKAVANRTEKISIKNKVLHLKLNSSVMRDELLHGKQVIIERVNQFAGEEIVNEIWFE